MLGFTDRRIRPHLPTKKSLAAATVIALACTGFVAATGTAAIAAPVSTKAFLDSKTDVPSGVGLFRTRVTNGDKVVIVTKHRNLRKLASDDQFTIFIDTRTSHPGPEYAIAGGLSEGTDWATGRATRRWHVHADPLDPIGLCDSNVKLRFKKEKMRVSLGRDCLGGYQGRVRVSVKVSDADFTDFGPAKKTFYPWVSRG
jgi:hypothetical protein